ncbi:hypothetical protein CRE_28229 [Caenorhabditis remanei]|uniref:CCHC-type domain-containing protein n=1 Tax=Caenorhabditis remanei TaxID=31234 RepID=E3LLM8_CAERE|nr:hypothetical protein CRE_28229 [Caenorhabditis remanei]
MDPWKIHALVLCGSSYGSLKYIRHRAVFVDQRMDPWSYSPSCGYCGSTDGSLENHASVLKSGIYSSGNEAVKSENIIVGSNATSIPLGLASNVDDVATVVYLILGKMQRAKKKESRESDAGSSPEHSGSKVSLSNDKTVSRWVAGGAGSMTCAAVRSALTTVHFSINQLSEHVVKAQSTPGEVREVQEVETVQEDEREPRREMPGQDPRDVWSDEVIQPLQEVGQLVQMFPQQPRYSNYYREHYYGEAGHLISQWSEKAREGFAEAAQAKIDLADSRGTIENLRRDLRSRDAQIETLNLKLELLAANIRQAEVPFGKEIVRLGEEAKCQECHLRLSASSVASNHSIRTGKDNKVNTDPMVDIDSWANETDSSLIPEFASTERLKIFKRSKSQSPPDRKEVCFFCGKVGHFAWECPKKAKQSAATAGRLGSASRPPSKERKVTSNGPRSGPRVATPSQPRVNSRTLGGTRQKATPDSRQSHLAREIVKLRKQVEKLFEMNEKLMTSRPTSGKHN